MRYVSGLMQVRRLVIRWRRRAAYVGTTLSRVDQIIQMQEPYTASAGDDYRCCDWTEPGEQYITGFNVLANPQIVHHVAAFWFDQTA